MKHATIKPQPDGYVLIKPDKGYVLLNTITKNRYSEAVVKEDDVQLFIAVKK